MRTRYFLLLLCLAGPFIGSTQKVFDGYFVNNQNDTVKVTFPDYRQSSYNPKQVRVVQANNTPLDLTTDNCRRFYVSAGDTYVSKHFKRVLNPTDMSADYEAFGITDSLQDVDAFLLLLTEVNGFKLYKYKDQVRQNYFLESADGSMDELRFKVYKASNSDAVMTDDAFKGQLEAMFGNEIVRDGKYKRQLDNLQFNDGSLVRFIENINHKNNPGRKKAYPPEVVVIGGISYNSFHVTPAIQGIGSTLARYNNSMSPVVGIGLINYQQRNFGRNFLTVLLKFYQFKNSGSYNGYYGKENITYQSQVLSLNLAVGRKFIQTPLVDWYVAIAPFVDKFVNNTETDSYTGKVTKGIDATVNAGLQTGVILRKRVGVFIHYNILAINVQQYVGYATNHKSMQAGISWQFKK